VALLPFSSQQTFAGTPGWRFAAHLLDTFLFLLIGTDYGLFALFALWRGPEGEPERRQALFLIWNGLWIVSFTVLEGLWGWSPGKFLLGLRVWCVGDSEPPGMRKAFVRTLAHFAIVYLAASVIQWEAYANPEGDWLELAAVPAIILGCL